MKTFSDERKLKRTPSQQTVQKELLKEVLQTEGKNIRRKLRLSGTTEIMNICINVTDIPLLSSLKYVWQMKAKSVTLSDGF